MSLRKSVLSTGEGFLDRVLCVVGAVTFSQAPEFIQQYLQRLGGHLDEARKQLLQYQEVAAQSGLTLDRLIEKTANNGDPAVAKLGDVISASSNRVAELTSAQSAIQNASFFEKPFVFLHHVDTDIARATWHAFRPAIPTTAEGFVYAVMGIVALLFMYYGMVRYPIGAAWRLRARRKALKIA